MNNDSLFMRRCLQLAAKGEGHTTPNPMVGAVIVHNDIIIGEGYHKKHKEPHAEVNAIRSVKNCSLLSQSTLYVSLEPCSHYGITPPCSEFIISCNIPRVVVAVQDPNPVVAGRGIRMMREAGIEVVVGVLEEEARLLNRRFFVNQEHHRPYIILKWAQSKDGYIDRLRNTPELPPEKLSNTLTQCLVHRMRTLTKGIMVGTNTALLDNPRLTARKWAGANPTRIVIDRELKIPKCQAVFDNEADTIVFTEKTEGFPVSQENVRYISIDFNSDVNHQILSCLFENGICSLMVEGGAFLLASLINDGLWDEAWIEIADKELVSGVKSPVIEGETCHVKKYFDANQIHLKNKTSQKFH